jgi:hypothetical protein
MTDDFNTPLEEPGTASKIVDGIKVASSAVGDAIETGLEPGMPLDIVVRAVREAPLAALGIAFMLGFVFARHGRPPAGLSHAACATAAAVGSGGRRSHQLRTANAVPSTIMPMAKLRIHRDT